MINISKKVGFRKAFVEGEIHLGFWGFVKKGIGFIDTFFILKTFTLYQYGLYQLLLSWYALLSDFFHDIFNSVTLNDISRFLGEGERAKARRLFIEYARFRFLFAFIPACIVFVASYYLPDKFGVEFGLWIRILAMIFVADAVLIITTSSLSLMLAFRTIAVRPTAQKLIQALILSWFFFMGDLTLTVVFCAQLISIVGVIFIMLPSLVSNLKEWRDVSSSQENYFFNVIRRYGFWELPQIMVRGLVGKIRPTLIRVVLGTEAVGVFSVAYLAISTVKDILPTRTLNTLIPREVKDPELTRRIFQYGTKYYVIFSILISFLGAIGFPLALNFIFPQYLSSLSVFYILLPTIFLFAFIKLSNIFMVVKRQQALVFGFSFFEHIIGLSFLFIFLPYFGIVGIAVAEVCALLVSVVIKYIILRKKNIIFDLPVSLFFSFTEDDKRYVRKFLHYN